MRDQHPETKVTLEDLLRVKRAERPSPEFWVQFERDFRARQLTLALEKKPWWLSLPRGLSRVLRPVPAGAVAVLAITFVGIRQYQPASVEQVSAPTVAMDQETSHAEGDANFASVQPAQSESYEVVYEAEPAPEREPQYDAYARSESQPREVATGPSPSAMFIAANLAAASKEPELAQFKERRPLMPNRLAAPVIEEPLGSVTPRDERLSRLFGARGQLAHYIENSPRESEEVDRIARRISENELYDSVRRWGAQADRLNLKL